VAASPTARAALNHRASINGIVKRSTVSFTNFLNFVEVSLLVNGGTTVFGHLFIGFSGAIKVGSTDFGAAYLESKP
jgi:hypothetical protein